MDARINGREKGEGGRMVGVISQGSAHRDDTRAINHWLVFVLKSFKREIMNS